MLGRNVYLMDEVSSALTGQVIATLLEYDQKSHEPIRLFVKTNGGYWEEAKRICDTILYHIRSPVITIAMHNVQSSGIAIMASGDLRLAFSTATFENHDIRLVEVNKELKREEIEQLARDVPKDAEESSFYETRRLPTHLVPCTLTPRVMRSRIAKAKNGEYKYKAPEAKRLGFVDAIITSVDSINRYERLLIQRLEKLEHRQIGGANE